MGATVVIMDDGLQNPSLIKDCAIAVVDGATGIGNGLSLPAGPLRAPMDVQWPAVDAVLVIGEGGPGQEVAEEAERRGKRVFQAWLGTDRSRTGLGRPEGAGLCGDRPARKVLRDPEKPAAPPWRSRNPSPIIIPIPHPSWRPCGRIPRHAAFCRSPRKRIFARIAAVKDAEPWPNLTVLPVRLRIENETGFRNLILRHINERRLRVA